MTSSATSSGERRRMRASFWSSQNTGLVASVSQEPDERALEVHAPRAAQLAGRPREEQLAVGEDENAVGPALGLPDVVRGEDAARALASEARDPLPQPLALARVQRGRRLVEQQHGRVREQADGDVHALLVAAG